MPQPYMGRIIRIRKLKESDDMICIYNAYHFREQLKKCGFFWDPSLYAWCGDVESLIKMHKDILLRFILSLDRDSVFILLHRIYEALII